MTDRTAIGFDTANEITLESFDLTAAAALAVPLEILTALDACHLDGRKIAEHLTGDIFHCRRTAARLPREVLFFQDFTGRVTIRTVLVKAVTDLCMKKTVRRDLDRISAVTAAQPDHFAIKALRRLFDRDQMTESFIFDIFNLTAAILHFFVSNNSRHTSKNNPLFFRFVRAFHPRHKTILSCRLRISRQKFITYFSRSGKRLKRNTEIPGNACQGAVPHKQRAESRRQDRHPGDSLFTLIQKHLYRAGSIYPFQR